MRLLLIPALLILAACTTAEVSRIDANTFRIEGPGIPGGGEGPNRREAQRVCPKGYYLLNSERHEGGPNSYTSEPGVFTNWVIRCIGGS